jgi:membrane protease YdiL (CAAX protease family)
MTVPDYAPPPLPRLARWPAVLAWAVILGCVGLIVVAGLRPRGPGAVDVAPERDPGTAVLMQSRIAVGFHRVLKQLGAPPANAGSSTSQFSGALDEAATSPLAKLRAVPAVAELSGGDAALARLDALRDAGTLPADLHPDLASFRTIYADGPAALFETERAALLARHGWFARLALSHGLPDGDPARRAALAPAVRAAWAMLAVFAAGGAACLAGLVLLVVALVFVAGGRVRPAHVPPAPGRGGPFAEAFAVYLLGMIGMSFVVVRFVPRATFAANWLLALAIPLALAWPYLRGLTWPEVRAGFGWHRGRGWVREVLAGVGGYVAALPLLFVAVLVTSVLIRVSGTTPSHPIQHEAGAGGFAHTLQLYLLAVVYAPLVEETLFRGALYHHVRRRLPWWLAALAVGVLFAAIHPQGWVGIPMLTTVALVFAALREWRGSIVAPVVCHACVNAVTLTMLVLITA